MFNNPIFGGSNLIRESIQSPNYSVGVAGWALRKDGSAEFNSAIGIKTTGPISAGSDITVTGPNGSYSVLSRFGEVDLQPPNSANPAISYAPAVLRAVGNQLDIEGVAETLSGVPLNNANMQLTGADGTNPPTITMQATNILLGVTTATKVTHGAGHNVPCGERGSNSTAIPAASTSVTSAVIPFATAFTTSPIVIPVLTNTSAASAQWIARAINITTTQFQILFMGPSAAAFTAGVQWIAIEIP